MMLELLSGAVQMKHIKMKIGGCMSFKEHVEMSLVTATINAYVYIEIVDIGLVMK